MAINNGKKICEAPPAIPATIHTVATVIEKRTNMRRIIFRARAVILFDTTLFFIDPAIILFFVKKEKHKKRGIRNEK
jgi:hypothetical protein